MHACRGPGRAAPEAHDVVDVVAVHEANNGGCRVGDLHVQRGGGADKAATCSRTDRDVIDATVMAKGFGNRMAVVMARGPLWRPAS